MDPFTLHFSTGSFQSSNFALMGFLDLKHEAKNGNPDAQYALGIRYKNEDRTLKKAVKWLKKAGTLSFHQGQFQKALEIYQLFVQVQRKIDPTKDSPRLAEGLKNIGNCFTELAKFKEAIKSHKQALGIWQMNFPNGVQMASALSDIGRALQLKGCLKKSREYYLEAQKIYNIIDRAEAHPDFATSCKGV